jgi:hypothetical protein
MQNVRAFQDVAGPILDESRGPMGLAGRAIGLGVDELDAGIPGWAWLGVGVIIGAGAAYALHDRLEAFIKR